MNGKNVITTTKVPMQGKNNRRRRRGGKAKTKIVYVEKPIHKNSNKGRKGPRRAKRNNNKSGRKGGKVGKMSNHLSQDKELGNLANVMMNPFHQNAKGARLKDQSNSVTDTFFVKTKGTGATNSNGNGWITCTVGLMVANDLKSICFSNSDGSSGDGMNVNGVYATSGSPFTSQRFLTGTDTNSENAFRPVGVGIRVRNLSTVFQSSGVCYTIQSVPRVKPLNTFTPVEIQKQAFKEYPYQNDNMHAVTRHITDPLDYCWQWLILGESESILSIYEGGDQDSGESLDNPYNLGIYIVTNGAQKFEWEVYAHYERKGVELQNPGIAKPNQQGMADLTYSMGKLRLLDPTEPDHAVPTKTSSKGGGWFDGAVKGILDKAWEFLI